MPLLTAEETRNDRPVCSKCNLTFFRALTIQVHRPCRERPIDDYKKPSSLFAVRDGVVLLKTEVAAYEKSRGM